VFRGQTEDFNAEARGKTRGKKKGSEEEAGFVAFDSIPASVLIFAFLRSSAPPR
jgi:hypothetical protein